MTFRSRYTSASYLHTFRKDLHMQHIELRLQAINERHALERSLRDADRAAQATARSIRAQLGESLIRLGRRVAGERHSTPAWTG